MPQTSPMNWMMLSTLVILSIMYTTFTSNEKMNYVLNKKTKLSLSYLPWKW